MLKRRQNQYTERTEVLRCAKTEMTRVQEVTNLIEILVIRMSSADGAEP
jgi:hypothetical protein